MAGLSDTSCLLLTLTLILMNASIAACLGNCEADWSYLSDERICIYSPRSRVLYDDVTSRCQSLGGEALPINDKNIINKVKRLYHPVRLPKFQLPYLLHNKTAGNLVTDLTNTTITDCTLCNALSNQNPFIGYNSTDLLCIVVVNRHNSALSIKSTTCQPMRFVCSKPDISLSRSISFTGFDLAAVLVTVFLLVSVITSLLVGLRNPNKEKKTKDRSQTGHSSSASTKDVNAERKKMQEKLNRIGTLPPI